MAPPERGTAGWPGLISQRRLLVSRSLSRHGELQGTGGGGGQNTHTTHAKTPDLLGVPPAQSGAVVHYGTTATRTRCRGASGICEPRG